MTMASTFVSRVLSFAPLSRKTPMNDDEYSPVMKNAAEYLSRSSLLSHVDDDHDDVTAIWSRNLERLREQRMRPFTASAVAVILLSCLVAMIAGVLTFVHYRQMVIADEDQDVVVRIGMGCAGAIAGIALIHACLVWRFAATGSWIIPLRFSDFAIKLSVLALLVTTAFTLRLWDDEPFMNDGTDTDGGSRTIFSALSHPLRTVVLSISGALFIALVAVSLVSVNLPYRPSTFISVSAIRTLSLLVAATSFGQCLLGMSTIVGAPTTFFEDPALWSAMAVGLLIALAAVSLAGSVHSTTEATQLPTMWLYVVSLSIIASVISSIFVYIDAVPVFTLPLTVSDSLFAVAALGFSTSFLLTFTMAHVVNWKVNESKSQYQGKSKHELHWEV